MRVLGINSMTGGMEFEECRDSGFNGHDSAAVLLDDGEVVAAVEEERLNRVKHTNFFPRRSIRWVLESSGLTIADVDLIAVNFSELEADRAAQLGHIGWNPGARRFGSGRELVAAGLQREFGVGGLASKVRFCSHHLAHAWSAFHPSGFRDALVIVIDGAGPDGHGGSACALVGTAQRGSDIEVLKLYPSDASVGNGYTMLSSVLGYRRFDEYKVMGLAPYGDPSVYRSLFSGFYELLDDGEYRLASYEAICAALLRAGLVGTARKRHEPFTQSHKDYAAALQEWLETIVLHVVTHFRKTTGLKRLCLAGGVAHNCTLNGKLLYSGLFDQVFVQPAAHDPGGAYGAALSALFDEGVTLRGEERAHLYTGPSTVQAPDMLATQLDAWSDLISYEHVPDGIERTAARLLAEGNIIGWVQGCAEFGPRALGNRSILGDPRPAENKARINEMVKKREGYRPFAPSVLEERLHDVFDVPRDAADFSHMLFVVKVKEQYHAQLAAITHVDGTARIQTVAKETNPRYWRLIREFEERTGVPVLLNTSFNNNVEPIVTTVDEAMACFLTTDLHYLVIETHLIAKKQPQLAAASCLDLVATIPPGRRLVRGIRLEAGKEIVSFALESTTTEYFLEKHVPISGELFQLLQRDDGKPMSRRAREAGLDQRATLDELGAEVSSLWQRRVLTLSPMAQ